MSYEVEYTPHPTDPNQYVLSYGDERWCGYVQIDTGRVWILRPLGDGKVEEIKRQVELRLEKECESLSVAPNVEDDSYDELEG